MVAFFRFNYTHPNGGGTTVASNCKKAYFKACVGLPNHVGLGWGPKAIHLERAEQVDIHAAGCPPIAQAQVRS